MPDLSHDGVDLDEEANLAYVAATRAKEYLYISYAQHNSKSKDEIQPSRYFARFFNKKNSGHATRIPELLAECYASLTQLGWNFFFFWTQSAKYRLIRT